MAAILNSAIMNSAILDSAILVFPLKLTHTCQDRFPPFAQKKLHSFILTQLDDGSHLKFCHHEFYYLGFSNLSFSSQTHSHLPRLVPTICTKNTSLTLCSPPLAQKKLHSFIMTELDDGSHLEFCHLEFCHLEFCYLDFRHLSFFSQTRSQLPRLVPTICTKNTSLTLPSPPFAQNKLHSFIGSTISSKKFTHWFWLNLMMTAILNSAILDSDTAILDSDTLLSSLWFTQKHSHSTLTLTQTNSIWL